MKSPLVVVATLLLWSSLALAAPRSLKLDRVHSKIGFTASTLLFDVDGHFEKFDVKVEGDSAKPATAKLSVSIDVASIATDNSKRDQHLRAPDFFDAKKFPKIQFVSSKVSASGKNLTVEGTLTMHGKQRKVRIPFKVVKGKNGAGTPTKHCAWTSSP